MTETQKRYNLAMKKLEEDLWALADARGTAARDARKAKEAVERAKQSADVVEAVRSSVLRSTREQISAGCALRAAERAATR